MSEPRDSGSDDGWIPLPDVSRGPASTLPPPAPPLHIEPGPVVPSAAAPSAGAPKRSHRRLVAALAAVIALGGVGAAGIIVATRQDDDSGDGSDEGFAAAGEPVAAEYLDKTNITPDHLSFAATEQGASVTGPCSDLGALDALPTTSSGAGAAADTFEFAVLAGSFATAEEAEQFGATIAELEPCEYWHPDVLEQVHTVEPDGAQTWVYYDLTDREGDVVSGVDTYIVAGKLVGVVSCTIWHDDGWDLCDEVVSTFAAKLEDVAATYG